MFTDYVMNGSAHGEVGEGLSGVRWDPGMLRPYKNDRGVACATVGTGRMTFNAATGSYEQERQELPIAELQAMGVNSPVFNATALRKEEWIMLDSVVERAARLRLRAWADLAGSSTFGGFNGMSKMVLEHETMSDPSEAIVDMDGLGEGRNDAPLFQLEGLPLPITHAGFWFSSRKLAISRNTGTPLDSTMAEAAGRRVAEMVEKTTIGVETGVTYGGNSTQVGGYSRASSVFGYTNFTNRLTKTNITAPTTGSWVPSTTLADVLAMRNQLYAGKFYGPFMLYHSNDWDTYLDNDYYVSITSGAVAPTKTLRTRLKEIEGITDVRRLDYLASSATTFAAAPDYITAANPFTLIMVQMTSDVCRAVNGMDLTVVQWESQGGMRLNFKVMCIWVPQIRADYAGKCGLLHATTS